MNMPTPPNDSNPAAATATVDPDRLAALEAQVAGLRHALIWTMTHFTRTTPSSLVGGAPQVQTLLGMYQAEMTAARNATANPGGRGNTGTSESGNTGTAAQ